MKSGIHQKSAKNDYKIIEVSYDIHFREYEKKN